MLFITMTWNKDSGKLIHFVTKNNWIILKIFINHLFMEVNFFHKNMSKEEIEISGAYFQKKRDAIESLLTTYPSDSLLMNFTMEKFDKHTAYNAEMRLVLNNNTILASEASHDITKAIDLAKDRMILQIKKHLNQLRNNRTHKTIRKNHEQPVKSESFEI